MRMKLKDVYLILQDTADTLAIAGSEMRIPCYRQTELVIKPDF